ncbi:hypothetical protein ACT5YT_08190 [Leuconostoc suionicum]
MEEKLFEIIKNQSGVISDLTKLVEILSSQLEQDIVVSGFKKTSKEDVM